MIFCPNCGNQLPDSAAFCKYCGRRLGGQQQVQQGQFVPPPQPQPAYPPQPNGKQKKPKKAKQKGSKLRVVLISVSCFLIVAVAASAYGFYRFYWNSPEQQILRDISSGDLKQAARTYNRELDDEEAPDTIVESVNQKLDEEYTAFQNGEKSYSAICKELDDLSDMEADEVQDKVTDTQEKVDALNSSRTAFESGNEYMDSQDYENAITQYQQVIAEDSNYDTAQSKLEEATNSYRDSILNQAKEKADAGNTAGAISILESGLKVLENDSDLTKQLNQYESQQETDDINEIVDSAKQSAEGGDYATAIKTLQKGMDSYPDDSSISSLYQQYAKTYQEQVLKEADDLIAQNDYDTAISKLTTAKGVLPDSTEISDKLDETKANKPVELTQLKSQNMNEYFVLEADSVEDVTGTMYSGNNIWRIGSRSWSNSLGTCEFYTGGNYASFSAVLAPETAFGEDSACSFEIYADGVLKYSVKVEQKTTPVTVSADITGAQWIEIRQSSIDGTQNYAPLILSNPVLKK